jgi:ATP-binding cassette, subfamily F, member 3
VLGYSLCVYNLRCENEGATTDVGIRLARWSVHQPRLFPFLASAYRPKVLAEFIESTSISLTCTYGISGAMEAEIKSFIPNIDPVLSEYSVGYLNHASNIYTPNAESTGISPLAEAAASITALLVSASGDDSLENEKKIRQLVEKWVEKYSAANGTNGEQRHFSAARRLDQAIQVGAQRNMSSTLGVSTGGVDLESANVRKLESKVDRKKLEKAERKIAAKQNKKTFKAVEYEASRLLNQPDDAQSYEEFFMAVNPLQLGSNAQGQAKSKDVKLDGVDVSIGGLRILTDTSLTLAYGRRYGLVGQNGIGKSTLLRALARRELAIPVHISILHVEQEVTILLYTQR